MLEIDKALLKGFNEANVMITRPELVDTTVYAGYTDVGKKGSYVPCKTQSAGAGDSESQTALERGGYKQK